MSNDHDLKSLLDRVLAGNGPAFEALLAKIRPYLHLLVRQQLTPDLRGRLGDSDVVQETLVRINGGLNPASHDPARKFHGPGAPEFLAWVSQIVRNVVVDLARCGLSQKRDERREVPGSEWLASATRGSTPEQAAERVERALQLTAALERLPRHQRDVLEWRVFEQLSYAVISERTGKSEGALRVVAARALEALRADGELRRLTEAST